MCPCKGLEELSWMARVKCERADQWQFDGARLINELVDGHRSFYTGKPVRTALFNGLDGNSAPFINLLCRVFRVHFAYDTLCDQRDDPVNPQFGGFLDDSFEEFSFRDGLGQGDLKGQGRGALAFPHIQNKTTTSRVGNFTFEGLSCTIQHVDVFASAQAQDVQGVVRLPAG